MKKNAFTIPEILIFMVIVGVICTMMMTVIKPNDSVYKYAYYNAYYVLSTTALNVREDAMDKSEMRTQDATIPVVDTVFPKTATELIKKFAQNPDAEDKDRDYGYINTVKYQSKNVRETDQPEDKDFAKNKESFIATNSMRFFVSSDKGGAPFTKTLPDSFESNGSSIDYFIVWVDLNGERKPNTATATKSKKPDIVPFVVTTSGQVVPVGYPTVDTTYLGARVKYPSDSTRAFSSMDTFYNVKHMAYGTESYPQQDLKSVDWWSVFTAGPLKIDSSLKPSSTVTPKIVDECKSSSDGEMGYCTVEIEEMKAF